MRFLSLSIGLFGAICFDHSSALAMEPDAATACGYFAEAVDIETKVQAPSRRYQIGPFAEISRDLGRYVTLATSEFIVETGTSRADGSFRLQEVSSAQLVCLADSTDRRVLSVKAIPGPSTGTKTNLGIASEFIITGIMPQSLEVGAQVHQGKY